MEWSGQKDFGAAPTVTFKVDGSEAGQLKSHGPLIFLKVNISYLFCVCMRSVLLTTLLSSKKKKLTHTHACTLHSQSPIGWSRAYFSNFGNFALCENKQVHDAGHMVPMDQPKAALEMLKRWMQGTLAVTNKDHGVSHQWWKGST